MRFAADRQNSGEGLAVAEGHGPCHGVAFTDGGHPGSLGSLVASGQERLLAAGHGLLAGQRIDLDAAKPLPLPLKILYVGLNFADRSAESGFKDSRLPHGVGRVASSLIGTAR